MNMVMRDIISLQESASISSRLIFVINEKETTTRQN